MDSKEKRFTGIIKDNEAQIQRICSYYSRVDEDRKDMYQEILINIWKSLDNFRGDSSINTWIYRIAVNTSLTFSGKALKSLKLHVDEGTQNLSLLVSDSEEQAAAEKEIQYELLEAEINQLSVIDKAMITLVLEGLSIKEIADIIGITMPNVKVKIHRIKETLREKLNTVQL